MNTANHLIKTGYKPPSLWNKNKELSITLAIWAILMTGIVALGWGNMSMIYSGLTAISTSAAVGLSLWLSLRKEKTFSLIGVGLTAVIMQEVNERGMNIIQPQISVNLENHRGFEMVIFGIFIIYTNKDGSIGSKTDKHGTSTSYWGIEQLELLDTDSNNRITFPAYGQYSIFCKLYHHTEKYDYNDKQIFLRIQTSLGTETFPFPEAECANLILHKQNSQRPRSYDEFEDGH